MLQALLEVVINLQVPHNAGNFLISSGPVGTSGMILLHVVVVINLTPCIPLR